MRCGEPPWNGTKNALKRQGRRSHEGDLRKLQRPQVKRMSAVVSYVASPVPAFPAAVEARWETQNRTVWNELEHASEERELVYAIRWIAELGIWRRFLRSNRKVQS